MGTKRLKKSFSAGELDPLLGSRLDFSRRKDGCRALRNMVSLPTGGVTRRPGLVFIQDMEDLDDPIDMALPLVTTTEFDSFKDGILYQVGLVLYRSTDGEIYLASTDGPTSWPVSASLSTNGTYLGNGLAELCMVQYGFRIYCAQVGVVPFYLEYDVATSSWSANEIAFTNPTADWGGTRGYPRAMTFHQERSVWGGNFLRPQAIWGSAIGEPENMGTHSDNTTGDTLPEDGYSFNLSSNTWSDIMWMYSGRVLQVGTRKQEWTVTGDGSAAVTPLSVDAVSRTSIGSSSVQPVKLGVLNFVGHSTQAVYEFSFDYVSDDYITRDKTVLAQSVFDDFYIHSWGYQRLPYGVMWMSCNNPAINAFLGCTLVPEHKITAWHTHVTDGAISSLSRYPGVTKSEDGVFVVIKRVIDGTDKMFMEYISLHNTHEYMGVGHWGMYSQVHLDSFVKATVTGSVASGITHLAGEEVSVLADGTSHAPVIVNASGEVTLNNDSYTDVYVGLPFESEVRPYLEDVARQNGVSHGQEQRVTNLDIDFFKTKGAYIGVSRQEEDGTETETVEDLPFRTPSTPMSTPYPGFTGVKHVTFLEGWDRKSEYFLRSKGALPMTVLGVVDTVEIK